MTPVAEAIAAVGPPAFMHSVREESSPGVVFARWRHSGGTFDIAASDIVQVTNNLQEGVPVRHQTIGAAQRAS